MTAHLELTEVSLKTPAGRALFEGLNLAIGDEHVALVGRNGVGKSTLLSLLAGHTQATAGKVRLQGKAHFVPQIDDPGQPLSRGELRQVALREAYASRADILLLDEPTLHLDDAAVAWLRAWLTDFRGCVIVASHDRRILADIRHFFVVSEGGCHYFGGSLAELERHLEQEHQATELRYVRSLNRLAEKEAHSAQVARRRDRKKRSGRCRELDRATPRIRLNQKRGQAQVSQGRLAKLREQRLVALRGFTRASRRALGVDLSLELAIPELPSAVDERVLALQGVAHGLDGRPLFADVDVQLGRQRIAVVGPNGAGKTTLLQIMLGQRRPQVGSARANLSKIGWIEQGGKNWMLDESLRSHLLGLGVSSNDCANLLVAHKFPLALADRPLVSLSPGERARAALIAVFSRSPSVEVLVLDEPTFSLDLVGLRALTQALQRWPGGLVVASHDRDFLQELGMDRTIVLGG
jgi:ATPase subunit of ABC transporter with duplicated ATPase domains